MRFVSILAGGAIEFAPASEGGVEFLRTLAPQTGDERDRIADLRRALGRQGRGDDAPCPRLSLCVRRRRGEGGERDGLHRQALGIHVEIIGDRLAQRFLCRRQPLGMDMGGEQVGVYEVDRRSLHDTGDQIDPPLEVILVVRALRRAVGYDESGLSAAPRSARALGVVSRGRRRIAQVDDVELRDVDAQLHRRRAVKQRQEIALLVDDACLARHLGHAGLIVGAEAEAAFAQFAQ
ncbi:hypothetical protein D9M70_465820 [compost metagenome]